MMHDAPQVSRPRRRRVEQRALMATPDLNCTMSMFRTHVLSYSPVWSFLGLVAPRDHVGLSDTSMAMTLSIISSVSMLYTATCTPCISEITHAQNKAAGAHIKCKRHAVRSRPFGFCENRPPLVIATTCTLCVKAAPVGSVPTRSPRGRNFCDVSFDFFHFRPHRGWFVGGSGGPGKPKPTP